MTDQPHDPPKPNDPLGDALRRETPAPGPGYWDAIDARLAATAAERPDDAVIHLDHPGAKTDTEDRVIRLTDMNTTAPSPTQPTRTLVVAIAAVAALIVGIVGFAALRDDAPTPVESAATIDGSNGAADGSNTSDNTDGSTDGAEQPVDSLPGEEFVEEPAPEPIDEPDPAETSRRCYYEQYLPEDDPDPDVWLIFEFDGNAFRRLSGTPGPDGEVSLDSLTGVLDAEGLGQLASGGYYEFWDGGVTSWSPEGFEPFTAAEVDCDTVPNVDERFAMLADGSAMPDGSAPTVGAPADAGGDPIAELEFHETLIGLSEADAQAATENAGRPWRVVSIDGEALAVTKDLIPDRVNATLVDGIVTETSLG